MGRIIDGWAIRTLFMLGAYLLYLNAWHSVALALFLTAVSAACLLVFLRGRGHPCRPTARETELMLLGIACMDENEAAAVLDPLLRKRFPGERFTLLPVLKHPAARLSAGDVLALWKAHRGAARLCLAATCPADADARACARGLSRPDVAVVDAAGLRALLARQGMPGHVAVPPRERLRGSCQRLADALARPLPRKLALLAPAMLLMYLRLGHPLYLFAALWLIFRQGAARLSRQGGNRLFAE